MAEYDEATDTTTVANHITYDAFGNVISESAAVDHLFGYTGRAYDEETGLQNNLNRWYDSANGKWLSKDPIGFEAGDANLYRYVGNSSTLATDPDGQVINFLIGAGIGAGLDIASQMLIEGRSFDNISWGSVAASAAIGAVTSGIPIGGGSAVRGIAALKNVNRHRAAIREASKALNTYVCRNRVVHEMLSKKTTETIIKYAAEREAAKRLFRESMEEAITQFATKVGITRALKAAARDMMRSPDSGPDRPRGESENTYTLGPGILGAFEFEQDEMQERAGTDLPLENWFENNIWKVTYWDGIPIKRVLVDKEGNAISEDVHLIDGR